MNFKLSNFNARRFVVAVLLFFIVQEQLGTTYINMHSIELTKLTVKYDKCSLRHFTAQALSNAMISR